MVFRGSRLSKNAAEWLGADSIDNYVALIRFVRKAVVQIQMPHRVRNL